MERITFTTMEQHAGQRIDSFIAEEYNALTRSAVQKLCGEGHILVSGQPVGKNFKLKGNEMVEVLLPPAKPLETAPQDIPLTVAYEDRDIIVVDKPKGMVVHPAAGNEDGTLVNALLYHCQGSLSGIGGVARPGIVHRIDKDTSGLLIVAKTDAAHVGLSKQVKAHSFRRIYHAVAYGNVKEESGTINAPIGRHPNDRKKMWVTDKNAREAVTHYTVYQRYQGFTYLHLQLETGRTHQIRVHLRHIGHPVAGDAIYGPKKVITSLHGQCLHAQTLGFVHPVKKEYMEFSSPLPTYFTKFVNGLTPYGI